MVAVTVLYAAIGTADAAALAWMIRLLIRQPKNPRLYALVGVLLCWVLSIPAALAANQGSPVFGVDSLTLRTVEHVLRLVAVYFLLLFITAGDSGQRMRNAARTQLAPLLVVVATLVSVTIVLPSPVRDAVSQVEGGSASAAMNPHSSIARIVYFGTENLFYIYVFVVIGRWAEKRRQLQMARNLRVGIGVVEIASAILVAATALLTAASVIAGVAQRQAPGLLVLGLVGMTVGLVLLVVGLAYPSVAAAHARWRVVRSQQRAIRELERLWSLIHEVLPEHELPAERGGLAGAFPLGRRTTRRYYRRVIECRDGLLRLGPYMGDGSAGTPDPSAVLVAIERYRSSTPDARSYSPRAVVLAEGPRTLADDAAELVELSRGLKSQRG
ncbi:MAB_1171c family putative transporter [Pseudonocardia sp. RS010]|uniref:MAB_1171c family putative transporter n=1 Tax=Pseudonocardia sp. RS010 TaxID=3385979 RepID=UPI0039A209D8